MKFHLKSLSPVSQLSCLVFISGFSALVLEIIYVKLLRYWAGNTAYAVAAVLCAYMAGLSLGAFAGGKWLLRSKSLLSIYGGMEFLVGIYSASLPWMMGRLKLVYLGLTAFLGPDTRLALFGHFLTAGSVLLLPTLLMGASFPVVVRAGSRSSTDRPDAANRLYASNLAGAALGALMSEFLLIRFWGLGKTLILVAITNAIVAALAVVLDRRQLLVATQPEKPEERREAGTEKSGLVLLVALAGGFLVLFQEIVWTHMVGRFLDNTVYGFALMLFVVIAGLGLGAVIVARNLSKQPAKRLLPWAFLATGTLTMIVIPFWDNARVLAVRYPIWTFVLAIALLGATSLVQATWRKVLTWAIASFAAVLVCAYIYRTFHPVWTVFWFSHAIDFAVCLLFMALPAVLMGTLFPLALEWYLLAARGRSPSVGRVYGANTVGSLAGIVVATFLVLDRFGVERSGRAVGLALFALGLLLLWRITTRRRIFALAIIPAVAWAALEPPWDFSKTHEVLGHAGRPVYAREDLNGGLTTVLRNEDTTRLFTNGLIQAGTDYLVADQVRIALLPVLHVREMDRAMVIGLGSGQTAGIVGLFPFKTLDLVDFSPGVVEAGQRYFQDINLGVYNNPKVKVHIADGRHYLLTHPEKLSLLTIQVSRLWMAGEGDLYTRELYELCAARLAERGVLQQWIPLFRLSFQNTLIILRTVREVFPHVALYLGEESGMIVASTSPLQVDYAKLRAIDSDPRLKAVLARIKLPSLYSLLGDCVLIPEGVDALLAHEPEKRISTDLWPHLEYSAARHYLEGLTTVASRRFFLTAQEFRTVPIVGADEAAFDAIRRWVLEERDRRVGTLLLF